jgi:catechol 2,3-dioxygenase-like lactoylglutathione lyase family enzyme
MSRQQLSSALGFAFLALTFFGPTLRDPVYAQSSKGQKENASMLSSSPIIAFVATRDSAKAKGFYQDVLKLKLIADEPFALVFDANGTMLRVAKVRELTPAPYTVVGWKVADISAVMTELTARGVTFEKYKGFPQDEAGVSTFPDGTKVAWFKDPDGNTLSVTQFAK